MASIPGNAGSNEESREKAKAFHKCLFAYIKDTLIGQERGMYRVFLQNNRLDEIRSVTPMLQASLANYLNCSYKSLIRKDDQYVIARYGEMASFYDHSKICLLNIVFHLIQDFLLALDRSKLDARSLDHYNLTLNIQYSAMIDSALSNLKESTFQCCKGDDIEKMNPEEDLFFLYQKE